MRIKPGLPSPAMLVAVIALVMALAGGAYAATKIDTKNIKPKAVTSKKIAGKAVTAPKLANEGVSAKKLAPDERSEGFVNNVAGPTALPATAATQVAALNLPAQGAYVINASVSIGNNAAAANLVSCQLHDDGQVISAGNGALPAQAVFAETISLTGTADGGAVTLNCQSDNAGQARNRVITAVRVGSLQAQ